MTGIGGLAAFVQEISRGVGPERPTQPRSPDIERVSQANTPQKRLMEVPTSPPTGNLPRGSLLDLRA